MVTAADPASHKDSIPWADSSYRSIAETNGTRFAFPQEQEMAGGVLVGGAHVAAAPATHLTRSVSF